MKILKSLIFNLKAVITKEEIEKLAALSRITLNEAEKQKFQKELDSILAYVAQIKEVSGKIKPSKEALHNVMREDTDDIQSGKHSEEILENAPQRKGNYFKVKKIL